MAYMIYQRYVTAVVKGHREDPNVSSQLETARSHRAWLEGLSMEPGVKRTLVAQARAIEEGFERLAAARSR
jgi:hypothetical protein